MQVQDVVGGSCDPPCHVFVHRIGARGVNVNMGIADKSLPTDRGNVIVAPGFPQIKDKHGTDPRSEAMLILERDANLLDVVDDSTGESWKVLSSPVPRVAFQQVDVEDAPANVDGKVLATEKRYIRNTGQYGSSPWNIRSEEDAVVAAAVDVLVYDFA